MTPQELNGARLLLDAIEASVGVITESLRSMEINRQAYFHEGLDGVGQFVATLNLEGAMGEALAMTARLDQMLAKFREILPKFEDDEGNEHTSN